MYHCCIKLQLLCVAYRNVLDETNIDYLYKQCCVSESIEYLYIVSSGLDGSYSYTCHGQR